MLRVMIELLRDGDEALVRTPASMTTVSNEDTGTLHNGHYDLQLTNF